MDMDLKKKELTNFFCIVYFIWGLFQQIQNTVNIKFKFEESIGQILNVFLLVSMFFLLLLVMKNQNFEVRIWNIISLILFFGLIIYLSKNQNFTFIATYALILMAGNFYFEDILKTFLIFTAIILISTIFLFKLGRIPNAIVVGQYLRVRSSLGFGYYTYSAQLLFYFTLAYLVFRKQKITYVELIILEAANYFIYYSTNTRNPYILSTLFILFVLVDKIFKFKLDILRFKLVKFIILFAFPICFIVLNVLMFWIPKSLFYTLNEALSGRLALNISGLQMWGVKLLGQKIDFEVINVNGMASQYYNFVDSSYFQTLLVSGCLFFIIIMILLIYICNKSIKEHEQYLGIALFLIAIHSMFDPQLLLPWYSPFCLLLGQFFAVHDSSIFEKTIKE